MGNIHELQNGSRPILSSHRFCHSVIIITQGKMNGGAIRKKLRVENTFLLSRICEHLLGLKRVINL